MVLKKDKKLIIFGTGEIGSLARFYFENDSPYQVVGFTADDEFIQNDTFEDLPLVKLSILRDRFPSSEYYMHVALSYRKLNKVRADKYVMAKNMKYKLASYVCSRTVTWPGLEMGDNCFILENQTIQPNVKIGNNVMIWSGNHIGHASQIGDHSYVGSHVVICGHVRIGKRCFLGVNSTIKDFTRIGHDVFVAMGAQVTRDIPDGAVVFAAKSEVHLADSKVAQYLKKAYFYLTN